jgi:hypothetical protein
MTAPRTMGSESMSLDTFTRAYIECALWSTNDESDATGGVPLDQNYDVRDLAPETLAQMMADCAKFQSDNHDHIYSDGSPSIEHAGHDFWLTRCGHGSGFWDGDWLEPAASALTAASKKFRDVDLYIGDDGKIYAS